MNGTINSINCVGGGVFVSHTVYDHVRDRLSFLFEVWGSSR